MVESNDNGFFKFSDLEPGTTIPNNVIIRTDGTVAPCFPMYGATFDWGNIDQPKFDQTQLWP